MQYTTSGADTLEIMYDDTQNSAIERRIYKSNTERADISKSNFGYVIRYSSFSR